MLYRHMLAHLASSQLWRHVWADVHRTLPTRPSEALDLSQLTPSLSQTTPVYIPGAACPLLTLPYLTRTSGHFHARWVHWCNSNTLPVAPFMGCWFGKAGTEASGERGIVDMDRRRTSSRQFSHFPLITCPSMRAYQVHGAMGGDSAWRVAFLLGFFLSPLPFSPMGQFCPFFPLLPFLLCLTTYLWFCYI